MNIYEFKTGAASDWVYAPNIEEAKRFFLNFTGCEYLEGVEIIKVPKSEWGKKLIIDPEEFGPEETFAEYAKRNNQTNMICSTEF